MPEIRTIPNDEFFALVLDRLGEGQTVEIPLSGISLNPLLQEGRDYLLLAPLARDVPLHRYDVVLFRYGDTYLLHRIRKINGETLVTRGDAINSVETLRRSDVVAILVAKRN
ncbi:MAG: S24/S26 family peptidase, partial [Bacteroidales bacterium]|nr:S24/S26 family peptidase [Bacteroidales bacterium]